MSDPQTDPVEVLLGQVSPHMAQLFVRLPNLPGGGSWKVTGRVRGPRCRHAHTLPAQFPLVDLGAGQTLLARGQITDPCFWSPELPALYQTLVELRKDGALVQTWTRDVGIRDLTIRGASLYQAGLRRVLRGAVCPADAEVPWLECRTEDIAIWVRHPSNELCRVASEEGVRVIAFLEENFLNESRRLAQWACVAVVVGPQEAFAEGAELKKQLAGVLLGVRLTDLASAGLSPTLDSADLLVIEIPGEQGLSSAEADRARAWRRPVIAWRRSSVSQSLTESRRRCDDLQGDLAPHLDCAGYFIDSLSRFAPRTNA